MPMLIFDISQFAKPTIPPATTATTATSPPVEESFVAKVATVARVVSKNENPILAPTRRCCLYCEWWRQKPDSCWWIGVCGKHGHDCGIKNYCKEVPP